MKPPLAPRHPVSRSLHGDTETDDYAWMRDHENPDFLSYLAAERAYYDEQAAGYADLTDRLAIESIGRLPAGDSSVDWPLSGFVYRTKTPPGAENLQFLRSRPGESAEQLLLDENIIGGDYLDVADRQPSQDGRFLAWSADTTGAEIYQIKIRDLTAGEDLPDLIERSYPGLAWSADASYLFYLVPDELTRPFQLWRHKTGSPASTDTLLYTETDARFELILRGSRSGQFAIITSASLNETEVRLIPLSDPLAEPVLVWPRRPGVEYHVDHARPAPAEAGQRHGTGTLYVAGNLKDKEFALLRVPAGEAGLEGTSVRTSAASPARTDTRLLTCDVVGQHLLLTLRRAGIPRLAITDLDGGNVVDVLPAGEAASIRVDHAEDYDAGSVIVVEESLVSPPAWYRLDLATGTRELLKRKEVPGYDESDYLTRRLEITARDGTKIPVTLAYAATTQLDGKAPCLLYGYGAYEACSDPEFDGGLISLLDRGVVYAIAHVRGGGEGGRTWWQAGRLRSKPTTFTDFTDVADGLDSSGVIDGRRIVARGLSAGGLLAGAVYSMRPDRWCGVIAQVPFVDVVTTMLDPSIPLTIQEWDEWGDPRGAGDYAIMRSYSPYDNPPAEPRPRLLITGAVEDPRVGIHEPAKWAARLRATADDRSPEVWFRAELGAGAHTGPSGRFTSARYEAEVYAFALAAMGISR